jgi:outer membrane protein TolC
MPENLSVIDNEPQMRAALSRWSRKPGYGVMSTKDGATPLKRRRTRVLASHEGVPHMEESLTTSFVPRYFLIQCVLLILTLFPLLSEAGRLPPFPPETPEEKQLHSEAERSVSRNEPFGSPSQQMIGEEIPPDFSSSWRQNEHKRFGNATSRPVTLEDLYVRAIHYSTQIKVFSDLPLIRETGIQEAKGEFDTKSFIQSQFAHTNSPVGSTLTTGGPSRFIQDEWDLESGFKKKLVTGTEVTISQQFSRTNNNSIFFVPNPQSSAQLVLTVVQPLLKGFGIQYNRSVLQIARIDSEVAMNEFIRQAESQLLEVARSYWALYAARQNYWQKAQLIDETAKVTDELRERLSVGTPQTALFRADSALASRRSDLVRANAAVRNAQDRLRTLISDPTLLAASVSELIPADEPLLTDSAIDATHAGYVALQKRPELKQAFLQLRGATIREKVSKNELLPELNIVLQGSLGGLDNGDVSTAYGNQFSTGGPGGSAGIVFSFPLENNEARARFERRQLETRQQIEQLRTTVDTVLLEVKISAREVETAYREAQAKYLAVKAFTEDVDTLNARRAVDTTTDQIQLSNYLNDILDTQDRRSQAEETFALAVADYQVALVNLERAKGNLLDYEGIAVVRSTDKKKLPRLRLEKSGEGKSAVDEKSD